MKPRFKFMELLDRKEPEPHLPPMGEKPPEAPAIQGNGCTDIEAARAKERVRYFISKGVRPETAQGIAHRLITRDREQDDRRSCAECGHQEDNRCSIGHSAIGGFRITELFRCKRFEND